jgi:L,D-peptidoglycan transpeptidase YkuD (ErfK/YbiS/YcfS/YnhG family)
MSRRNLIRPVQSVLSLATVGTLVAACAAVHAASEPPGAAPARADIGQSSAPSLQSSDPDPDPAADPTSEPTEPTLTTLPGLGPKTEAAIPATAQQVVLATGQGKTSSSATIRLFERVPGGWQAASPLWNGHNALHGWTEHHHNSDLHSPIGIYTLTAAGGLLPDPGTALHYTRSKAFTVNGVGFTGDALAGAFDYVIAIDYNRIPGTSPLDASEPLGAAAGTGIWLHVDHGGPTHACVSVPRDGMKQLLLTLDPAQHPVIVMGDKDWLAR